MTYDVDVTMRAVGILLDAENSPRVSGTSTVRSWGKNSLSRPPARISTSRFMIDRGEGVWSLWREGGKSEMHHTPDKGTWVVDAGPDIGDSFEYELPRELAPPPEVILLFPLRLIIWSRSADRWCIRGVERIDHDHVLHLESRDDPSSHSEIFLDGELGLPTRWTTAYGMDGGRKEIELTDLDVDRAGSYRPYGPEVPDHRGVPIAGWMPTRGIGDPPSEG